MSKKHLDDVIVRARRWPAEDQDKLIAHAEEIEARRLGPYETTPDEDAAIARGLAQAERGEFAPDEEVNAIWKRHGLA